MPQELIEKISIDEWKNAHPWVRRIFRVVLAVAVIIVLFYWVKEAVQSSENSGELLSDSKNKTALFMNDNYGINFAFSGDLNNISENSFFTTKLCSNEGSMKGFISESQAKSYVYCNIIDENGLLSGQIENPVKPSSCEPQNLYLSSSFWSLYSTQQSNVARVTLECYTTSEGDNRYDLSPEGKYREKTIDMKPYFAGKNIWIVDGRDVAKLNYPKLQTVREALVELGIEDDGIKTQAPYDGKRTSPLHKVYMFWNPKYYKENVGQGFFYEGSNYLFRKYFVGKNFYHTGLIWESHEALVSLLKEELLLGTCEYRTNSLGEEICPFGGDKFVFKGLKSGKEGERNIEFTPETLNNFENYEIALMVIITE